MTKLNTEIGRSAARQTALTLAIGARLSVGPGPLFDFSPAPPRQVETAVAPPEAEASGAAATALAAGSLLWGWVRAGSLRTGLPADLSMPLLEAGIGRDDAAARTGRAVADAGPAGRAAAGRAVSCRAGAGGIAVRALAGVVA